MCAPFGRQKKKTCHLNQVNLNGNTVWVRVCWCVCVRCLNTCAKWRWIFFVVFMVEVLFPFFIQRTNIVAFNGNHSTRKWAETEKNNSYNRRKVNTLMQWMNLLIQMSTFMQRKRRYSVIVLKSSDGVHNTAFAHMLLFGKLSWGTASQMTNVFINLKNALNFQKSRVCCNDGCLFISSLILFHIFVIIKYKSISFAILIFFCARQNENECGSFFLPRKTLKWKKTHSRKLYSPNEMCFS